MGTNAVMAKDFAAKFVEKHTLGDLLASTSNMLKILSPYLSAENDLSISAGTLASFRRMPQIFREIYRAFTERMKEYQDSMNAGGHPEDDYESPESDTRVETGNSGPFSHPAQSKSGEMTSNISQESVQEDSESVPSASASAEEGESDLDGGISSQEAKYDFMAAIRKSAHLLVQPQYRRTDLCKVP